MNLLLSTIELIAAAAAACTISLGAVFIILLGVLSVMEHANRRVR